MLQTGSKYRSTAPPAPSPADQAAADSPSSPGSPSAENVAEKAAENVAEKAAENVAEKKAEKAAENVTENVAEKKAEKTAEKVAEKAAEKAPMADDAPNSTSSDPESRWHKGKQFKQGEEIPAAEKRLQPKAAKPSSAASNGQPKQVAALCSQPMIMIAIAAGEGSMLFQCVQTVLLFRSVPDCIWRGSQSQEAR